MERGRRSRGWKLFPELSEERGEGERGGLAKGLLDGFIGSEEI